MMTQFPAIALIGSGAPLLLSGEVAVLAVVLEVLRARYVPAVRAQPGLIAWAVITLANRGATMAWLNPSGSNNLEPLARMQFAWLLGSRNTDPAFSAP